MTSASRRALWALLMILVTVSGCLQISYEIDIARNGSADVLVKVRPLPGVVITLEDLYADFSNNLAEMRDDYPEWEDLKITSEGDHVGLRFHVDDLSYLTGRNDSDTWRFEYGNHRFEFQGIDVGVISITVLARFPGEVLSTDGQRRGSREVAWQASEIGRFGGWAEVEPSSGLGSLVGLLLIGIGALVAVGIIGGVVRGRNRGTATVPERVSFCTECGARASGGASFCDRCGHRFGS